MFFWKRLLTFLFICGLGIVIAAGCGINELSTAEESQAKENSEGEQMHMREGLPVYITKQGTESGPYYCGKDNYEMQYEDSTYEEFQNYLKLLEKAGFHKYTDNTIGENEFVTYIKEEAMAVYVSWFENKSICQIVSGPISYLPSVTEPEYESVTIPSVTQIERAGANETAPGLSMILQLEDGSYVIIDGGPSNASDQKALLEFLKDNNPNEGKPVVTWMFTHAHSDHISLAVNFLGKYEEEIELKLVCYNFVDFETAEIPKEAEGMELCAQYEKTLTNIMTKKYPDAEMYIFHGGEKLLLPGCEIEFLMTHEDHWPNPTPWYNYTSSAWRMTIKEKSLIILGDCDITNSNWLVEVYGDELKSDMLQLTHHGFNGASRELYQCIDPDICFWPVNESRYLNDEACLGTKPGYGFNAWIRDVSVKTRQHYTASETVTLLYPELVMQ